MNIVKVFKHAMYIAFNIHINHRATQTGEQKERLFAIGNKRGGIIVH